MNRGITLTRTNAVRGTWPIGWAATALLAAALGMPSPAAAQLDPGLHADETLMFEGSARTYDVYVPESIEPGTPASLVVDMHGANLSKEVQRNLSGLDEVADREGFVVVYPQSNGKAWHHFVGSGEPSNDVGFLRELVAEIGRKIEIDPRRIYASGLSSGGAMSHRLACHASDVFSAIVAYAAPIAVHAFDSCSTGRPVPVLDIRSRNDAIVPFDGGLTSARSTANFEVLSAVEVRESWRRENGCSGGDPDVTDSLGPTTTCTYYNRCDGDARVGLCAVESTRVGGHFPMDNADDVDFATIAWDFMNDFALPASADSSFVIDEEVDGNWFNAATDGEGLMFDYLPSVDMLFIAWFTYTLEPVEPTGERPPGIGAPGQRWLFALLEIDGTRVSGPLFARRGGAFDAPPTESETDTEVGEISIEFAACDLAQVEYVIEAPGLHGSFAIEPSEKLVRPEDFEC